MCSAGSDGSAALLFGWGSAVRLVFGASGLDNGVESWT